MNRVGICALGGFLLFGAMAKAQNAGMQKTLDITVQVFDGRNGKPMADEHVLVFTGLSADAVKTRASTLA